MAEADAKMQGSAADKKELRARLSAIREGLGVEGRARADASIAEQVYANAAYLAADTVFTYLSVGSEVDTRAIIRDAWSRGKTVAVPRCVPHTNLMDWYRIEDFEGLERSPFGVEEPPADPARLVAVPGPPCEYAGEQIDSTTVAEADTDGAGDGAMPGTDQGAEGEKRASKAVALVPAFSFDPEGYRIGYGGGFYDVFLPTFDGVSIGLCRSVQLSDTPLPRFATDVPVDLVIADRA